jgi:hypothetical protein
MGGREPGAGKPGGEDTPVSCMRCHGTFTVAELVDGIFAYIRDVNTFVSKVPCCGAAEELQIHSRTVTRGYVYSSGSAHFEGLEDFEASALRVQRRDTEIVLTHHGRTWSVAVPPRPPH